MSEAFERNWIRQEIAEYKAHFSTDSETDQISNEATTASILLFNLLRHGYNLYLVLDELQLTDSFQVTPDYRIGIQMIIDRNLINDLVNKSSEELTQQDILLLMRTISQVYRLEHWETDTDKEGLSLARSFLFQYFKKVLKEKRRGLSTDE